MKPDDLTPEEHDRPPCFVCEKREAESGQILCGICLAWAETGCGTRLKGGVKCGTGGVCVGCFERRRAVASTEWVTAQLSEVSQERDQLRTALAELDAASEPYMTRAAPHEELFNGQDLRDFDRLAKAKAGAALAVSPGKEG